MRIFIDTNIFLTFYHFSSDDLEELKKLAAVIEDPHTTLYMPDQVVDEFKRNRETKIADALKKFQTQKMEDQFPQMCKEYPEYKEMRKAMNVFYENKSKIREKLVSDISDNTLKADAVIAELIDNSVRCASDDQVIANARHRMELGNPPGKKGSLGDAINWEILLKEVPLNEDLYFVSSDGDYLSPLNETINQNSFNKYLLEEWDNKKSSNIFFYQRLSEFLNDKFPAIKLASELERQMSIRNFTESFNFQMTHSAVSKLSRVEHFSSIEVNEMLEAILLNRQINWILGDQDVKDFVNRLLKDYGNVMDKDKKEQLINLMSEIEASTPDIADEDLTF